MEFYRRRLPHWCPEGAPLFVTWRLHGSMPKKPKLLIAGSECQRFAEWDRELDRMNSGPMWLKDGRIARSVIETLELGHRDWKLYELIAWVIMSNHVHILIQPHAAISTITRAVKKRSARLANAILGRTGSPFWQDESYDHWVRDSVEFQRIVRYIEWNPVRAGMADSPELYLWSSANGQVGNLPH